MDKTQVQSFLEARSFKIHTLKLAVEQHKIIGNTLATSSRPRFSDQPYIDGCIYQAFSFLQCEPLYDYIFNSFIAVIGNYDEKRGLLKAWENVSLSTQDASTLKDIRQRYADIRNNIVAHIPAAPFHHDPIRINHVINDIKKLENIFNNVRRSYGIPDLVSDLLEQFPVKGLTYLFDKISEGEMNDV